MKTEEEQYLFQFQLEIMRIKKMKQMDTAVSVAEVKLHDELTHHLEYINPFLCPVIVQNLMQYLNMNELVKCREVCQIWEHEARKLILSRKIFRLSYETIPKIDEFLLLTKTKFNNFKALNINLSFCDLANYAEQLNELLTLFGHQLLLFSYSAGNFRTPYHGEIIRDLIVKHLQNVTHLTLDNIYCDGFLHTSVFSPEAITRQQLCNLKFFVCSIYRGNNFCRNPYEHNNGNRKTLMTDILKMSSKLELICYENFPISSHDLIELSVKEICDFNPANLKVLEFGAPVFDSVAEQLVNSKLRLDCLRFKKLNSFELEFTKTSIKIVPKEIFHAGIWCSHVVRMLKDTIYTRNAGIEINVLNYLRTFRSTLDTILRREN